MKASVRAAINKANASHSTGPRTPAGLERSSRNAVKHEITARRMIFQEHEHREYERMTAALHRDYAPANEIERQFVIKIIDCHMRLNRIATIENNTLNFSLFDKLEGSADPVESMAAQSLAWVENVKS